MHLLSLQNQVRAAWELEGSFFSFEDGDRKRRERDLICNPGHLAGNLQAKEALEK